jgi:hypothetical protein
MAKTVAVSRSAFGPEPPTCAGAASRRLSRVQRTASPNWERAWSSTCTPMVRKNSVYEVMEMVSSKAIIAEVTSGHYREPSASLKSPCEKQRYELDVGALGGTLIVMIAARPFPKDT